MMNALVVYDSQYGNTERIAEAMARAIGEALASPEDVAVLRVSEVKPEQLAGLQLLVVGSPTQRFRPTPATAGLLQSIPANALKGVHVAAFDTRINVPEVKSSALSFFVWLFGPAAYAAKHIADGLKKHGGELIASPEGFFVKGMEGPLKDGELARAASWARMLVEPIAAPQLAMPATGDRAHDHETVMGS
jgi:flavodoxin